MKIASIKQIKIDMCPKIFAHVDRGRADLSSMLRQGARISDFPPENVKFRGIYLAT